MTPWDRLRRCADLLEANANEGSQENFDNLVEVCANLSAINMAIREVIAKGAAAGMVLKRTPEQWA